MKEMMVVRTCKFGSKLSPACFANFTIIISLLAAVGRLFSQLVLLAKSQRTAKFPSQVHCALSHCPSARLDWLPFQYLTFWEAAILSRLHWWVGGDHSYLLKLHTPLPCIRRHYLPELSTNLLHTTLLQTCCLSHLPTWREYSLGLMGFPCGMQIPRRQPSVP